MTDASPNEGRWTRTLRVVLVVLLGAAALAHVLATLQPPFPDESFITRNLLRFFQQRTILPEFAFYPTLYSYMVAPVTGLFAGAMVLSGMPPSIGDWREFSYFERLVALWPQRIVALACLAVACWLTYLIVVELTQRRWAGLLAATLLATSPGTLEYGSLGLPDIPTMMFTTAALLYGLRLARRESVRRNALLAGLLAGLAVAAKYNAVVIGPALLLAVWAAGEDLRSRARLAGTSLAAALAGFIIGCPGWLIAPAIFLEGVRYQMFCQSVGQMGNIGVPLLGQIELTAVSDPHILVLGLIGAVIVSRPRGRRREAAVLIALIITVYVVAAPGGRQRLHYLLPAWPAMVILGAWGIAAAGRALKPTLTAAAALAMVAACGLIVLTGFRIGVVPRSEDVARAWLHANVEPMAPMVVDWAYVPELIDGGEIEALRREISTEYVRDLYAGLVPYEVSRPEYDAGFLEETAKQYVITSSGCYERFFEYGRFAHRPPDPGTRIGAEFHRRKRFYEALFAGHGGWRPVYDVATGNGPRVVIFARGEALDRHGAQALELP